MSSHVKCMLILEYFVWVELLILIIILANKINQLYHLQSSFLQLQTTECSIFRYLQSDSISIAVAKKFVWIFLNNFKENPRIPFLANLVVHVKSLSMRRFSLQELSKNE